MPGYRVLNHGEVQAAARNHLVSRNPSANTRPPSDRDRSYKTDVQVKHLGTEVRHRRPCLHASSWLTGSARKARQRSVRTVRNRHQSSLSLPLSVYIYVSFSICSSIHELASVSSRQMVAQTVYCHIPLSPRLIPPSSSSSLSGLATSQHVGTLWRGGRRNDGSVSMTHQTLPSEST